MAPPPDRLPHVLAGVHLPNVLAAAELQPLRTATAAPGHLALAMCGGCALYVFDGPLPTSRGVGGQHASLDGAAQGVVLSNHALSPLCALAYVERPRAVYLVALQEDAGVAVWARVTAGKQPGEWRPLASAEAYAAGPPLALPPAAGHRGDVRAACVCAHTARAAAQPAQQPPPALVGLAWLLHSRDGGCTELLLRAVPLAPAGEPGRSHAVERLGKYADATALLCAGGSDLWVWTARGVAYRWCLHTRRCLARVDVAAASGGAPRAPPGAPPPVPALHHPTRELLALCADGSLLAVAPPLRPASGHDDGFADAGRMRVDVRRVSRLARPAGGGAAYTAAAAGPFLFVLHANALAHVAGVARSPFMLAVHHAPTGQQLALAELTPLGTSSAAAAAAPPGAPAPQLAAALVNAGAGGTFAWAAGPAAASLALVAPDACAALAAVATAGPLARDAADAEAVASQPPGNRSSSGEKLRALAALLGETSTWGGSLERCEAALAVALAQAALRAGCAPGTDEFSAVLAAAAAHSRTGQWRDAADAERLPAAVHPALRSLVALQPLLYAGCGDSPVVALAASQAADALREVYERPASTAGAADAFHVYTPLAATVAPLAVPALMSRSGDAAPSAATPPPWLWAALLDARRPAGAPLDLGRDARAWCTTGLQVAALASRECVQRREHAAAASLSLFAHMLGVEASCECAALGCLRPRKLLHADRLEATPAARASLLANALARVVGPHAGVAHAVQANGTPAPPQPSAPSGQMPWFEAVCLCLAASMPSALPLFVRATADLLAQAAQARQLGAEPAQLALRALQVLPPVLTQQPRGSGCDAAQRAVVCSHSELLCVAGRHAAGMWLALQRPAPGAPTDWATAVRLLERECRAGASSPEALLLGAPLMFEVLALKVCETLTPEDASSVSLHGVNPEDESETLAACVAHLFIAAKTVAAAVRRESTAPGGMAAHQPTREPPPTVLDAVHDLLEQSVLGWRAACVGAPRPPAQL